MTLVYTPNEHGLLVASTKADGGEMGRMLRDYDPDLRLVPQAHDGKLCWQVWAYRGPDREAAFILAWTDPDGTPRPLSSALLDEVRKHDKRVGARRPSADSLNERHRAEIEKQRKRLREGIEDDYRAAYERGRTTVGLGTGPRLPYWQRNSHLPEDLRR